MRKLLSSLLVLILRPSETGPRSGLQYVARTLGTLWTCTQRVDARAEGGSERPPLHQYRVTIQTPNHKLAGGAKFGTVPKQNPTSFCMSCDRPVQSVLIARRSINPGDPNLPGCRRCCRRSRPSWVWRRHRREPPYSSAMPPCGVWSLPHRPSRRLLRCPRNHSHHR